MLEKLAPLDAFVAVDQIRTQSKPSAKF